jgi:hypothetical protein
MPASDWAELIAFVIRYSPIESLHALVTCLSVFKIELLGILKAFPAQKGFAQSPKWSFDR